MSDVEMEQEVEETPPVDVRPFLFFFYTNVMKIICFFETLTMSWGGDFA